jgi:hypothetical protein
MRGFGAMFCSTWNIAAKGWGRGPGRASDGGAHGVARENRGDGGRNEGPSKRERRAPIRSQGTKRGGRCLAPSPEAHTFSSTLTNFDIERLKDFQPENPLRF